MFQHLNHSDDWPRVRRFGLEVDPDTGALTLRKLPGPPKRIAGVPGMPAIVPAPAGIAVGSDGAIYVSDAKERCVFHIDPLNGKARPLDCVGKGPKKADASTLPMGLAFQTCRNRLLIADALNSCIQVVDPVRERVVALWGQIWPYEAPRPCGAFNGLDGPEHLACDREGNVFVIDRLGENDARVVKLDRDGNVTTEHSETGFNPIHLAVGQATLRAETEPRECVLVLAIDTCEQELCLFAFNSDLKPVRASMRLLRLDVTSNGRVPANVTYGFKANPRQITAFSVIGSTAVVGLASTPPRVWCFEIGPTLASDNSDPIEASWLPKYDGPAVALGVRGNPQQPGASADLLLFAGPGLEIHSLAHRGAYRTQGAFLAGPFTGNREQITHWHRLRFDGRLSENGRMRWFTLSRAESNFGWAPPVRLREERIPNWFRLETQPDLFASLGFASNYEVDARPEPDEFAPLRRSGGFSPSTDPDRTPPGVWYAGAENQLDGLVRNAGGMMEEAADQLWIFGLIAGDGLSSPSLYQARLEHDEDGWLADLPEVYQRSAAGRAFMRSLLALLESRFEDVTEVIDRLPALFSPHAVSTRFGRHSPELDWLRATLALPTTPRLGDEKPDRERNIRTFADGPYWLARRGTPEGLRRLLWLATGVEVVIDEPGLDCVPSVIGAPEPFTVSRPTSILPEGVGSSNILGYSTLPDPDEPSVRLQNDLAHHFVARGYESDLIDRAVRELVERILRRLAPAHTTYSLQIIEPRARVGVQARLGVDAVVAPCQPSDALTLNEAPGPDAQIDPAPLAPTVGTAHLGNHTPLM